LAKNKAILDEKKRLKEISDKEAAAAKAKLDAIASIQKAIADKAAREAKAAADAAALIKCDYSCKTCSDEVSCDTCPKGYFITLKTKFCQKCPINCLTC
jgi:hypothetical protein